jgi:hypothetical protein
MEWSEVAMIVFSCVTANHLGLVAAIERIVRHRLPVINCGKCFSFWSVMTYGCLTSIHHFEDMREMVGIVATSFLSAYVATWLQLLLAFIDKQYNRIYEQIFTATDTADDGA